MKNLKKIIVSGLTSLVALPAMAQNTANVDFGLNQAEGFGLSQKSLPETVTTIIRAFMGLLGLLAVILILYGGFKWMTSQGEPEKVEEAKKIIISGIIGLVIIASAYGIASYVINTLLPK
ncbi:hypothetical protein A3C96_02575 [Candidatus Uhrbacteria bacterium RIFCSPHIGHO2_02_FULL_60_10]|uniref:DUF4134 domain-containing protein n=1 Tax=Candidatus Uhrbacteria bacterium RIFCSPHIGHO2_02_FULL_60_10 TaxID=1802392 RepID=A0A1F7U2Y1_9BACT|nr:MAG: hypothetical protein A3C96_02575 [Candidatus Uhrbacteria bacterium RIFCSPHIGHO2_02_FULL_60_10]